MDVLMPQLGETVAEGKIVKWFKAAGDAVKPGDNLFEIETDKTSMEVPATSAGTLTDIRFQVGETAKVGAVVAVIADGSRAGGAAAARKPAPPAPAPSQVSLAPIAAARCSRSAQAAPKPRTRAARSLPRSAHAGAQLRAGPTARRRRPRRRWRAGSPASAASICRAFPAPARMAASSPTTSKARRRRRPRARWRPAPRAAQVKALYEGVPYEEVPLDSMRATIATRLVEAKQTIPHFYLTADIEIGRLLAMRAGSQRRRAQGRRRRAGLQALAQRLHHQGLGGGADARARRQCGVRARTASCASRRPTSAWRSRSTAG